MGQLGGRAAVFLDRDGTLNVKPRDHDYVKSVQESAWLPGAAEGAARLAGAGFSLFVVSNQRGVARGLVDQATLAAIEAEIQAELTRLGARVEAFRYCPHDLEAGCDCRKPAPGLIVALGRERALDLARSWTIGDSAADVAAGQAAGTATVLVSHDAREAEAADADLVAPSLLAASEQIVRGLEAAAPGSRPSRPALRHG